MLTPEGSSIPLLCFLGPHLQKMLQNTVVLSLRPDRGSLRWNQTLGRISVPRKHSSQPPEHSSGEPINPFEMRCCSPNGLPGSEVNSADSVVWKGNVTFWTERPISLAGSRSTFWLPRLSQDRCESPFSWSKKQAPRGLHRLGQLNYHAPSPTPYVLGVLRPGWFLAAPTVLKPGSQRFLWRAVRGGRGLPLWKCGLRVSLVFQIPAVGGLKVDWPGEGRTQPCRQLRSSKPAMYPVSQL